MQDLEVYIARPASASTRAISLTGGRLLRDQEYRFSMGNAFVPAIAQCVPESGMRIGDSWVIPRSAAIVLLGEGIGDGLLTGRLSEVAPVTGQVSGWEEAQIDVEGRVTTGRGPTAVRARLTFRFLPESGAVGSAPAPLPAAENKDESAPAAPADAVKQQDVVPGDVVRGLGGLSKIRLSQVSSTPSLGEGLPAVERRRQLVLERRWPGTGPELPILEEPPAETAANSWLEYTDPQGRFHFMHPQDLRTKDASELLPTVQAQLASGDVIMLGRPRPEGEDVLTLFYLGGQQPKHEDLFQAGFEKYRAAGFQVDVGEATKLAAEDWEGVEATRIEAMLTAPANQSVPGAQSRTQFDGYLLRFTQNASLMATSSTRQTEVGNFRNEVEQVLQTFRLGPPQSAASP
jgi:hypothetical protein